MTRGNTPRRTIRIDQDLWDQINEQAAAEHINVSDLIRGLLRGWLNNEGEK